MLTPIPAKSAFITQVKTSSNSVLLYSDSGVLRVCVYEPDVFRVSFNFNDASMDVT